MLEAGGVVVGHRLGFEPELGREPICDPQRDAEGVEGVRDAARRSSDKILADGVAAISVTPKRGTARAS